MTNKQKGFQITDAQWEVLEILWAAKTPLSVSQIKEALASKGIQWKNNTIHTFLVRLGENGVTAHTEVVPKQFYPLVAREECLREENQSFLQKAYKGSVKAMISTFIKDGNLSPEELAEIRQLLEDER